MIPIRDTTPSKNIPVVNNVIIGVNVLVFLIEMSQGGQLMKFLYIYGLVPARYTVDQISGYFSISQQLFSFLSFMFLHGGFLHLLGNMWSLYIFGDNVEDYLGPLRYLVFYLVAGVASGVTHLLLNPSSNVPTIGASGSIAGVMGAYFILHPNSRILTLIPIIFIPWFVEIPAYFFLGLWFILQFLRAAGDTGIGSGIAWWAHIGGFVFGIVFLKLLSRVPTYGFSGALRNLTAKKTTHRLQVVRPKRSGEDPNLYGTVTISPFEALTGTRKLVNLPGGFQKRMVRVAIPPGVSEGTKLRLKGLGKQQNGSRGDLYLKVSIGEGA